MQLANSTEKRILIAGGGTGGHVYPALATVEALRRLGSFRFLYIGGHGGIETRIVPQYDIPLRTIRISGFARSLSLKNLLFPVKLLGSLISSWRIIREFRPHVAVGMGGYVSGPILFAAAKMGVPLLIQEQDSHPGVTTRLLARHARRICLAFEQARKQFDSMADKLVVTGNPVRAGLSAISRADALANWQLDPAKQTVFIFGGSQGSRSINTAISALLPQLLHGKNIQLIWQTGEGEYEAVVQKIDASNPRVRLLAYIADMPAAYSAADVIICRAGASSLAELAIAAKAAILIPYPHAAGNHQELNSLAMQDAGAALMIKEGDGWQEELHQALMLLLSDAELRGSQSASWRKMAKPDAAEHIAREIIKLIPVGKEAELCN